MPLELSSWSSRLRGALGASFPLRTAPLSDNSILLIEAVDPQLIRLVRRTHPGIGLLVIDEGVDADSRALLDAGADDVVHRPTLEELAARIRALSRRRAVAAGRGRGERGTGPTGTTGITAITGITARAAP